METLISEFDVDEEEALQVEVDLPDGKEEEFLSRIRLVDMAAEEEGDLDLKKATYANWDEMKAVAEIKKGAGVWQRVNCLPEGSEIHLGNMSEYVKKTASLERRVRAKSAKYRKVVKATGKLVELPNEAQTRIFILATFGTAVKGWRGPGFEGANGPVAFTLDNYAEAIEEFDEFRAEVQDKLLNLNPAALESIRGNS